MGVTQFLDSYENARRIQSGISLSSYLQLYSISLKNKPPPTFQEQLKYHMSVIMASDVQPPRTKKDIATLLTNVQLERNTPLRKTLFQPNDTLVYIHVGTNNGIFERQEVFAVHNNLLCSRSDYFKAALTGGFAEAKKGKITLDDEDPEIFRRFWSWLYADSFYKDLEVFASWSWAFDLYTFAEKRFIPDLQNAVMDSMLEHSRDGIGWPSPETQIPRVWGMVSEGSPLRAYMVDCFLEVGDLDYEFSEDKIELYPVEFVVAIAVRAQQLKRQFPEKLDAELAEARCQRYHVNHRSTNQPCQEMMKPLFEYKAELWTKVYARRRRSEASR